MIRTEYHRLRRAGYGARLALDLARTFDRWDDAEADGLVRVVIEPDDDPAGVLSFLDLPEWNDTRQARAARASILRDAERDGVWIVRTEHRCPRCGSWEIDDSLGGLIGDVGDDDPRRGALAPEYRADLYSAALDALPDDDEGRADR